MVHIFRNFDQLLLDYDNNVMDSLIDFTFRDRRELVNFEPTVLAKFSANFLKMQPFSLLKKGT